MNLKTLRSVNNADLKVKDDIDEPKEHPMNDCCQEAAKRGAYYCDVCGRTVVRSEAEIPQINLTPA